MNLLTCMLRARRIEERIIRLYHQGRIMGGCYLGYGQEAIGAGTTLASGPHDLFTPLIRDLTVHLGRGMTTHEIFRHWLARSTGLMRGRDGNIHFGDMKRGIFAMISHLGAMLPVLAGGIMARRRRGEDAVGFGYIGDGATSTGDFHEAVNFAAVLDVPVIFVIENNKYAYSTPSSKQFKCARLIDRAQGYGIEGHAVDGNDALAVHAIAQELAADLRRRPRAVLLECDTLRIRGHGEHDSAGYVPAELRAEYARRDPIDVLRRKLTTAGLATVQQIEELDRSLIAEVDAAVADAQRDPAPCPGTLQEGVYAPG